MKTDVPTYNFLLELIYEYQNRKNSVVFHVDFCFLILSFWGFSIMLFLICFFCHFITPIGVDYQCVTSNQQDFKKKVMLSNASTPFFGPYAQLSSVV